MDPYEIEVSHTEAGALLGVTRQAIDKRVNRGTLRRLTLAALLTEARAKRDTRAETRIHARAKPPEEPELNMPASALHDRWWQAWQRWRRRLTRTRAAGYLPGWVPVDAVHWITFELAAQGVLSLESAVEVLGAELGMPTEAQAAGLKRPVDFLLAHSCAWLTAEDGFARLPLTRVRWRARGGSGEAAVKWDKTRAARAARAKRGGVR